MLASRLLAIIAALVITGAASVHASNIYEITGHQTPRDWGGCYGDGMDAALDNMVGSLVIGPPDASNYELSSLAQPPATISVNCEEDSAIILGDADSDDWVYEYAPNNGFPPSPIAFNFTFAECHDCVEEDVECPHEVGDVLESTEFSSPLDAGTVCIQGCRAHHSLKIAVGGSSQGTGKRLLRIVGLTCEIGDPTTNAEPSDGCVTNETTGRTMCVGDDRPGCGMFNNRVVCADEIENQGCVHTPHGDTYCQSELPAPPKPEIVDSDGEGTGEEPFPEFDLETPDGEEYEFWSGEYLIDIDIDPTHGDGGGDGVNVDMSGVESRLDTIIDQLGQMDGGDGDGDGDGLTESELRDALDDTFGEGEWDTEEAQGVLDGLDDALWGTDETPGATDLIDGIPESGISAEELAAPGFFDGQSFGQCEPFDTELRGHSMHIDHCEFVATAQNVLTWFFYALAAFFVWRQWATAFRGQ